MDSIASAISPALEDEEIIMDQLKELVYFLFITNIYYYFGHSVNVLIKETNNYLYIL